MANYKFGEENNQWKGGNPVHWVSGKCYQLTIVGKDHHLTVINTYAYLHRVNAEIKLGRRLTESEVVTFKDENTMNCELDNLIILENFKELLCFRRMERPKEKQLKRPKQQNELILCRCGCGTEFLKYDKSNRPRYYVSGHNARKIDKSYLQKKDEPHNFNFGISLIREWGESSIICPKNNNR